MKWGAWTMLGAAAALGACAQTPPPAYAEPPVVEPPPYVPPEPPSYVPPVQQQLPEVFTQTSLPDHEVRPEAQTSYWLTRDGSLSGQGRRRLHRYCLANHQPGAAGCRRLLAANPTLGFAADHPALQAIGAASDAYVEALESCPGALDRSGGCAAQGAAAAPSGPLAEAGAERGLGAASPLPPAAATAASAAPPTDGGAPSQEKGWWDWIVDLLKGPLGFLSAVLVVITASFNKLRDAMKSIRETLEEGGRLRDVLLRRKPAAAAGPSPGPSGPGPPG